MRIHYDGGGRWESHIPLPMREIDTEAIFSGRVKALLPKVEALLRAFDQKMRASSVDEQELLVMQECDASWRMAEGDKLPQLFAFLPHNDARRDAEVLDLRQATRYGVESLAEWPICSRLICDIHYLALKGERHESLYHGALQRVHETCDYESWVYFFLRACAEL